MLLITPRKALSQEHSLYLNSVIPVPNVFGRIDHMSYNPDKQYIYIASLGNNSVEVADLKSNKIVRTIKGFREPQGVVYIREKNLIFVTNGYTGICDILDADSYAKVKSIKLTSDADNVRYDSTENKIYVGYGNGGMAVIDAVTLTLLKEIKLSGHPESFQIDKTAERIYVNIPFQGQVEVININTYNVIDVWKLNKVSANFPMGLDEKDHRLFIGCRDPARLLIINAQTGKTIQTLNIDKDTDDLYYNASAKQIYLSCGSGYLDIFSQIDPDSYVFSTQIPTHPGAGTSLYIPELNKLIVACPARFSTPASLLTFDAR